MTRKHDQEIVVQATPERVFSALVTPSDIRGWWGVARAIVVPQATGIYALAWGDDEDGPEFAGGTRIAAYDPPRRLLLDRWEYYAKAGPLPFSTDAITVEFTISAEDAGGARVRVVQEGFPDDAAADEFYAGCETGWRDTLAALKAHLESS